MQMPKLATKLFLGAAIMATVPHAAKADPANAIATAQEHRVTDDNQLTRITAGDQTSSIPGGEVAGFIALALTALGVSWLDIIKDERAEQQRKNAEAKCFKFPTPRV